MSEIDNTICPFCLGTIKSGAFNWGGFGGHLRYCRKIHNIQDHRPSKLLAKLLQFPFLTEDFLKKEYIEGNRSLPELQKMIKQEYNSDISYKTIIYFLDWYKIPRVSIKERRADAKFNNKREQTCLKKYGHINPLGKNTEPYHKKNKTVQEKYGVTNVFQLPDHFEKTKEWCLRTNGISFNEYISKRSKERIQTLTTEEKTAWLKNSILKGYNISKIEAKFCSLLLDNGFSIETQFPLRRMSGIHKNLAEWYYDIKIKNTNILIEINGDYWHANPKKYKESDILTRKGLQAKEIWEKDRQKKEDAIKSGYVLLTVWESDFPSDDTFLEFLFDLFNKEGVVYDEYSNYRNQKN